VVVVAVRQLVEVEVEVEEVAAEGQLLQAQSDVAEE
jgi:hypothetical protein